MPSGIMVALYLPPEIQDELAVDGGEPVQDLHVTLCYVPKLGDDEKAFDEVCDRVRDVAEDFAPVQGWIGGVGRFNASESSDGKDVFYASYNAPVLPVLQQKVTRAVDGRGIEVARKHGFTPHITLKYLDPSDTMPNERISSEKFKVAKISVASKNFRKDIELTGTRVVKMSRRQVSKSQPGSSAHVNVPIGSDVNKPKKKPPAPQQQQLPGVADQHERSIQPTSPPAPAMATTRSSGVTSPPVANLDVEIEKEIGDSDGFESEVEKESAGYCMKDDRQLQVSGNAQMGDSELTAENLYGFQTVVEAVDYEMALGQTDQNIAIETALSNLEEDPNYYKRKRMEADNTSDDLARTQTDNEDEIDKDTQQTEDESTSSWPVGLNLDLGSGPAREPGHIGFDVYPHDHGTVVHDLNMGIPVPDQSAQNVRLVNSLEYMDMQDPKPLLSEIQRVLMPGGQFTYEGPNEIYNYPEWTQDYPGLELQEHEQTQPVQEPIQKIEGQPWVRQKFSRIATPDAATANDAEPRIGVAQYDQLPADALLAMDALGYYWSDSTSSGRGNRVHGYPSQGALLKPEEENKANNVGVDKAFEQYLTGDDYDDVDDDNEEFEDDVVQKDELTARGREHIADHNFALPEEKKYPIQDLSHARNALARSSGKPEEEKVRTAVYRKYQVLKPKEVGKESGKVRRFLGREVQISKAAPMKQIAYCVVLSPDELDDQDDWMQPGDIEDAAHSYLINARKIKSSHSSGIDAVPVESYIAPQDMEWEGGPYGPQTVKKGSWVIGIKVNDPKEWKKVMSGEYQGVSVGGFGLRE
jgi:2'-5' RNA ligase